MKRTIACLVLSISTLTGCGSYSENYEKKMYQLAESQYADQKKAIADDVARVKKNQDETDLLFKRQSELLDRSDALAARQEKQADRWDALLDQWEKQAKKKR